MPEFAFFIAIARCFIKFKCINIKRKTSIPYKVTQEFFNILKIINNYILKLFHVSKTFYIRAITAWNCLYI